MPALRVVTFDLWNTILLDSPAWAETRRHHRLQGTVDALAAVGLEFSSQRVMEAYQAGLDILRDLQINGRDCSFLQQVITFVEHIQPGLPDRLDADTLDRIVAAYRDAFFVQPPVLAPHVHETLAAVRDAGYRLALISNTGATPGESFRHYLRDLDVMDFFEVTTFSDEMELAKPAPRIFLDTLERLSVAASEAVHVGDHLYHDVAGAKGVGMLAVWVRHGQPWQDGARPDAVVEHVHEVGTALGELEGAGGA